MRDGEGQIVECRSSLRGDNLRFRLRDCSVLFLLLLQLLLLLPVEVAVELKDEQAVVFNDAVVEEEDDAKVSRKGEDADADRDLEGRRRGRCL